MLGQRYLLACVVVDAVIDCGGPRSMTAFAGVGKRLHFHQELDGVRRGALELIEALPVALGAGTFSTRPSLPISSQ